MSTLFGGTQQPPANKGLFGNSTTQTTPFGAPAAQAPAAQGQTGSLFGGTQNNQTSTGTGSSLFGGTQNNQTSTGMGAFGGSTLGGGATQQQSGGLFGGAQKPQTSLFGQQPQQQQQSTAGGLFGATQANQQQGSVFGGQQQQQQTQQPQQSQFGQTTMATPQPQQQKSLSSSLWSPGRAISGVHRTVPMQVAIIKDKWDSPSSTSPFRAYLYNNVGEEAAPFYQPGPEDDETKWEEALRKRPGPGYVPVLVKGFWDLGKRAQRQRDFLTMMQSRLHEINNCLTGLLSKHDLSISVKIADCRRKHIILSKRCLALAAKTQILRNRGYAMDEAEEELKKKLLELERHVFDPSLNGRAEEIWARMLAIHEHSKRLQVELDRAGVNAAQAEDDIDEQTLKTAKKILDDYHSQIQHLQKEMASIKNDFEETEKAIGN